jgi:hypothetical protein
MEPIPLGDSWQKLDSTTRRALLAERGYDEAVVSGNGHEPTVMTVPERRAAGTSLTEEVHATPKRQQPPALAAANQRRREERLAREALIPVAAAPLSAEAPNGHGGPNGPPEPLGALSATPGPLEGERVCSECAAPLLGVASTCGPRCAQQKKNRRRREDRAARQGAPVTPGGAVAPPGVSVTPGLDVAALVALAGQLRDWRLEITSTSACLTWS